MASGTISLSSTRDVLESRIKWSSTSNGSVANTSSVTAKLQIRRNDGYETMGTWGYSLKVGSKTSSSSEYATVGSSWVTLVTVTNTISHSSNGKGTCAISGEVDGPAGTSMEGESASGSKTVTLDTIPRASSVSCADGNIGSSTTINISRASSSFTHTLTYSFSGLTGTIATKTTSTSIGWTIPTSFYAKIPNAKSGSGTITCETFSGSTSIGTKTCTFNAMVLEASNKPTITATVVDINEATIALTGDANKLVKYFSNAQVDITATAKNSATIKSQKVVCGGKTGTATSNTLKGVESGTFNLSCADSRGFTASATITKTIVNYIKLAFTDINLSRPSTTSNTINCSIQGNYFNGNFGQTENALSFKYRYRVSGGEWGEYINSTLVISGNTFTYEANLGDVFDFNNAYDFEFVIEDELMVVTEKVLVTRGIPLIDIGEEDVTVNKQIYMGESRVLNYDDLYYKSGDNVTLSYSTGGYLTTGGTEIAFSIPLPKRMNNVTPTIESGTINVRKPEGGYLLNNVSITENNTISFIKTENLLTIRLIYNEAFSDIPNNTALAIQAMNVKINFR